MYNWIEIDDSRESQFPVGLLMPRHAFRREMKRLFERGGSQPIGKVALLGISKVVRLVYSASGIKSLD